MQKINKIYQKLFSPYSNKTKVIWCVIIFILTSSTLFSQNDKWLIDSTFNNLDWQNFILKSEKEFDVKFYFDSSEIKNPKLKSITVDSELLMYLKSIFTNTKINISADKNGNIFLIKGNQINTSLSKKIYQEIAIEVDIDSTINTNRNSDEYLKTSKEHLGEVHIIGNTKTGRNQKNPIIKGRILDSKDKKPIFGATVFVEELGTGKSTDQKGRFSLKLKKGKYTLVLNEINHREQKFPIHLLSNGKLDFILEPETVELEGVIITAGSYDKVKNTTMGVERLITQNIKEIPLILGERDILKVASLLPGIQSVGEGSGGFNVRGSPADQNLFSLDEIPIYNTSHFFGFFSVFNSEAISEFSLSKANIPARFGGRLASIFDITAKEGDKKEFKVRGGISPITGRVMFEGPIQKNKSSFMVGLRSTYSDWVLNLIDNIEFKNSSANFADAIFKLSYYFNTKNKIQATGYYSFDKIDFAKKSKYDIQNQGVSLKWKHFFNSSLNMDLSLIYSKYDLLAQNKEFILEAYQQDNILEHNEAKVNFIFQPTFQHKINFGVNSILYKIDRGQFLPVGDLSHIIAKDLGNEKGLESGIFISDEWNISDDLSFLGGLRYNLYSYLGPKSVFEYQQNLEKEENSIIDTLQFSNNEFIKSYSGLDYRFSVKYELNNKTSIKASYNRLHQYIFLLSNTIALSPTDSWKLSDYNITPMVGDQFSIGFYNNLFNKTFEFSLEGYYKKNKNLVEFKDGADLLNNTYPEWNVLQGKLDIYGIEVMLKKSRGRFFGWINYTYSNASVLVDSPISGEQINFGNTYPANHDKPHSVNVVANWKIRRRLSLSSNLVYSTGKPITYPTTIYYQNGIKLINFTSRNAYRVPDYFRMDMSLKIEGNLKAKKKLHGVWVFSVYNVLGRHNVYNAYFKIKSSKIQGYKVSIFANPIFSITYNFKFGNYDY